MDPSGHAWHHWAIGTAVIVVCAALTVVTAWGGAHYALQDTGKMAIKTNIECLKNNLLDEFVTIGPKDGSVSNYVRSIALIGDYGQIYASKISNGMYQIADGHHRVEALRKLGYEYVKFYLIK